MYQDFEVNLTIGRAQPEPYADALAAILLTGCPEPFRAAFRAHIEAWRSGEHRAIAITWDSVVASAKQAGVEVLKSSDPDIEQLRYREYELRRRGAE